MVRCGGKRAGRRTGARRLSVLRPFANQTQHIAITYAEYRTVDDDKRQQTDGHMQVAVSGDGICGTLYAVDNPRLAPHLGGHPAREDSDKSRWPHP